MGRVESKNINPLWKPDGLPRLDTRRMDSSLKKSKLLYLPYFLEGLITIIIIITIKKYEVIALIDREKNSNDITTLLVIRIKGYLIIEYKLNIK